MVLPAADSRGARNTLPASRQPTDALIGNEARWLKKPYKAYKDFVASRAREHPSALTSRLSRSLQQGHTMVHRLKQQPLTPNKVQDKYKESSACDEQEMRPGKKPREHRQPANTLLKAAGQPEDATAASESARPRGQSPFNGLGSQFVGLQEDMASIEQIIALAPQFPKSRSNTSSSSSTNPQYVCAGLEQSSNAQALNRMSAISIPASYKSSIFSQETNASEPELCQTRFGEESLNPAADATSAAKWRLSKSSLSSESTGPSPRSSNRDPRPRAATQPVVPIQDVLSRPRSGSLKRNLAEWGAKIEHPVIGELLLSSEPEPISSGLNDFRIEDQAKTPEKPLSIISEGTQGTHKTSDPNTHKQELLAPPQGAKRPRRSSSVSERDAASSILPTTPNNSSVTSVLGSEDESEDEASLSGFSDVTDDSLRRLLMTSSLDPSLFPFALILREYLLALVDYTLHTSRPNGERGQASGSSSGNGGPTAFSEESRDKTQDSGSKKRRYERNSSDGQDDYDDDEDDQSKRQKSDPSHKRDRPDISKLFSCPFAKRYPKDARFAKCNSYSDISRLKEHLARAHALPIRCGRCRLVFKGKDAKRQRENHLQQPESCPFIKANNEDCGIAEATFDLLKDKMRGREESFKWKRIYKILFPDEQSIPHPYIDPDAVKRPTSAADLHILEQQKEAIVEGLRKLKNDDDFTDQIFRKVRKVIDKAYKDVLREPKPSQSSAGAASSSDAAMGRQEMAVDQTEPEPLRLDIRTAPDESTPDIQGSEPSTTGPRAVGIASSAELSGLQAHTHLDDTGSSSNTAGVHESAASLALAPSQYQYQDNSLPLWDPDSNIQEKVHEYPPLSPSFFQFLNESSGEHGLSMPTNSPPAEK